MPCEKIFVNSLIIITLVTECTGITEMSNAVNTMTPIIPQEETALVVSNINLRHNGLTPVRTNDAENELDDESYEIVDKLNTNRDTKSSGRRSRREPKVWDQWGNWSGCSVTCGIGTVLRWRHCISGSCLLGEKKAQFKTCTLAAC